MHDEKRDAAPGSRGEACFGLVSIDRQVINREIPRARHLEKNPRRKKIRLPRALRVSSGSA